MMARVTRLAKLGLCVGGILLASAPTVWAQSGNLSDVTGPIITTGDLSGLFTPRPPISEADVAFVGGTDGEVAVAVNDALRNAIAQLEICSISAPSTELPLDGGDRRNDCDFPRTNYTQAQVNVAALELLSQLSDRQRQALIDAPTLGDIQGILIDAGIDTPEAAQLTQTIDQLRSILAIAGLSTPQTIESLFTIADIFSTRTISASQLQTAVEVYNALINNASLSFLQNPPAEFQVFQSLLETLVSAGISAEMMVSDQMSDQN